MPDQKSCNNIDRPGAIAVFTPSQKGDFMIQPTVGRVVHYVPNPADMIPGARSGELAAIVAAVHDDRCVNLCVIDANGEPHGKTSVRLVQPGDPEAAPPFCQWMPYQLGQAAKTEQLQKQLEGDK